MSAATFLSGYRIMWMMVMFDLPTTTKSERKEYTRFRNYLLDKGFDMTQYSVYFRVASSKERVKSLQKKIAQQLPRRGNVQILTITDKQYEDIKVYQGFIRKPNKKNDQLHLF